MNVITGANGQLGSHIAEQLRASGEPVRGLAQPGTDTSFLRQLGVEIVQGDLTDAASLGALLTGAEVVYHCAARVSDWGPWSLFEANTVRATHNVAAGCVAAKVARFVHVSSVSVYGLRRLAAGAEVAEDAPLAQSFWLWDYYTRAKAMAEQIVWKLFPNATVLRPSWIYGPRDQLTLPRFVKALQEHHVPIIGPGDNLLNIIYAGDVATGAILAANNPIARGQAYNLCGKGDVTQRDLLNALTDVLKLPRIERHVARWLAMRIAFLQECRARLVHPLKPPTVSRRAISLLCRSTRVSTAKARSQLGWQPRVGIREGVKLALEDLARRCGAAAPRDSGFVTRLDKNTLCERMV